MFSTELFRLFQFISMVSCDYTIPVKLKEGECPLTVCASRGYKDTIVTAYNIGHLTDVMKHEGIKNAHVSGWVNKVCGGMILSENGALTECSRGVNATRYVLCRKWGFENDLSNRELDRVYERKQQSAHGLKNMLTQAGRCFEGCAPKIASSICKTPAEASVSEESSESEEEVEPEIMMGMAIPSRNRELICYELQEQPRIMPVAQERKLCLTLCN